MNSFQDLAKALEAHRAPAAMIDACRAAARDEVPQVATRTKLAVGATPYIRKTKRVRIPTLLELATDNVRREMKMIAKDETTRALLAKNIGHWAYARLDAGQRARVAKARATAIAELRATMTALDPG